MDAQTGTRRVPNIHGTGERGMQGLISAALFAACVAGAAQAEDTAPQTLDELDARLAQAFTEGHVPGASVAVIENGQVVLLKGYGNADVAKKIPATPDTIFRAGSISKSLTGIAVMTLVEQRKLDLHAKLADVAPEVKFTNPWEATDPVRVAHLLEHTTGWPDISLRVYLQDGKNWTTLEGVQATSGEFVSRYRPGRFSVYNNAGPAVAGYLLEKASGKTFSEYLRDDVMRRMGMPTSDFDLPPVLEERLARSYEPDGSQTPYQYIILPPAGSLATSARELAQLVLFFIGRGTVDGNRLVSSEGVERIERSETTLASDAGFTAGYGLGNAPFPGDGLVFRGHNGGIDSFTSVFGYRVEGGLGFVLLANGGDGVNFDSATTELVKSYLLRHSELKAPTTVSVSADELSRYAGFYRTVTPPNSLTEPYADLLSFSRVSAAGDHLVVSGKDYFPVGPHSFRRADRDAPSLGFVYADDGVYKIGPFSSQVQQPIWRVAVLWLACGLLIVGLLLSIVMLPVWLIGALRGRLERRGGAAVRFVPVLGYAALIATFALPLLQITSSGMKSLHRLAEVGPYSLTIFACSLLFPLCALLGIWLIWKRRDASRFARVYAIVACLGLLSATLYAAGIGWLGAMTWRM
jgi:CubicO group peptidase (beta-lactamase class C family)